jgi:hypothetical protein
MHARQAAGRASEARGAAAAVTAEELLLGTLLPALRAAAAGRPLDATALPHADAFDHALPAATSFVFDEDESARHMVAQLRQDCPALFASRDAFLARMAAIYDDARRPPPA